MIRDIPFGLGATSLTYPNLDLVENIRRTSDEFDLVELTLEYPRNLPLDDEKIGELNDLKAKKGLEYSVHLPLSIRLATTNPHLRSASVEVVAETYEKAERLDPLLYTLHVSPVYYPGGSPLTHLFEIKQFEDQLEKAKESLRELKEFLDPEKIAVENLFTDMRRLQGFLKSEGYRRCLDVGHLVKRGEDPVLHYYENSDSIINIHLHGVIEGNDHQQIEPESESLNLVGLLEALQDRTYEGPIILEQFDPEHLSRSLATMASAWKEVRVVGGNN
ncbi:MAG: cobamide remodeling phosphodiesterase CbiR [Candidatus Bipolaricaulota bacterium]|nr:sugar phosphate isomerase/epimerase [Candidatus Bipolaricaulota bacterium]MBS3791875.1 sugar phosphate isomerase/epimerase [Candidatus Bipolaricaulota bacterium]